MRKTTVYLPDDLKARIEGVARAQGRSEAAVIRTALAEYAGRDRPRPRLPLVSGSGVTEIADHVDDLLADGFGRR